METLHSTPKIIQVRHISQNNAIAIVTQVHKVDITEGASAQFPTWIFNFRPHGQLRTEKENIHCESLRTFGGDYQVFMSIFEKYYSISRKNMLDEAIVFRIFFANYFL